MKTTIDHCACLFVVGNVPAIPIASMTTVRMMTQGTIKVRLPNFSMAKNPAKQLRMLNVTRTELTVKGWSIPMSPKK
jgi:hypothetical protein